MSDRILASPPLEAEISILTDWVEFSVLVSKYQIFRLPELERMSDEVQDEENTDLGDQDSINERLYESVVEELSFRGDCLSSAYPFEIDGSDLKLVDNLSDGCYIYLYCLFFSHCNREEVILLDPPSTNVDRDLLQICSTYAAAAIVDGGAVSFGYPRPDHSGFLTALKSTYEKLGEGEVRDRVPAGAPANEKDSRVDVIAWGNTLDGAAGKAYLLGQVATGKNWDVKSIRGEIKPFHDTWFTQKPPSEATPAMFIPFCIDPRKGSTLEETMRFHTYKFGNLYYRYRLPKHAEDGLNLARNDTTGLHDVERVDEFPKVKNYVDSFLDVLVE